MLVCRVCKQEKSKEEFSFQHRKLNPEKRKTICKKCDCARAIARGARYKKEKAQYDLNYYRTIHGHTLHLWKALNNRVKRKKSYQDLPVTLTKQEFLNWIRNDPEYLRLFSQWQAANYDIRLTPTVDRIDGFLGYEVGNVQILKQHENSSKKISNTQVFQ